MLADSDYARQDEAVYFRDQRIPGADAASFVADDMSTAHDRRRRYLFEEPVAGQDAATGSQPRAAGRGGRRRAGRRIQHKIRRRTPSAQFRSPHGSASPMLKFILRVFVVAVISFAVAYQIVNRGLGYLVEPMVEDLAVRTMRGQVRCTRT